MDHVVREIEPDLVDWKIGVLDVLPIDDVVIAVVADEARRSVDIDLQYPDLECFAGHALFTPLRDGDRIEKPIGSAFIGNVFCAVGEQDVPIDTVTVPAFGTGELSEIFFTEFRGVLHDGPLSFE
jgi:hypothetical protein